MKTLVVLFGGTSSEYEVSLHSAAAVVRVINRAEYNLLTVGITKNGQWLLYPAGAEGIEDGSWCEHPGCKPAILSPSREDKGLWVFGEGGCERHTVDLAFPVLHGRYGEDGTIQGLLELAGIPVVGCGCLASGLGIDKAVSHILAQQAGIPCPRFATVFSSEGSPAQLALRVQKQLKDVPLPWFVKPALEGSSFGITRVTALPQLTGALQAAFRYGEKVVVEEGIDGFEVGCAVLGNTRLTTGEVDAIRLAGGFFDYHEKYNLETAEILLLAPIPPHKADEVKQLARQVYTLLGCKGFARVDFFLSASGQVFFNEINTIPGMTDHSRYPRMMQAAGMDFAALVARLLELAVEK